MWSTETDWIVVATRLSFPKSEKRLACMLPMITIDVCSSRHNWVRQMIKAFLRFLVVLCLLISNPSWAVPVLPEMLPSVEGKVFYVDDAKGHDGNAGTINKPWKTLQHAADILEPGQTVEVREGIYTSSNYTVLAITRSGDAAHWIKFKAYPGERPKIVVGMSNWQGIEVKSASYIVLDGFEVIGHQDSVTLDKALAEMRHPTPYASSSGIAIESRDLSAPVATHIIIRNMLVHDHPLGGISVMGADYVTVEDNKVYHNGLYSSYGGSGISLFVPRNSDQNTRDYKLIVQRNVVWGNANLVPCGCWDYKAPTDGNGIILDTFDQNHYNGRSLVINNVVYGNGGRGIHALHANDVDIAFNTTVGNSLIAGTGEGEITVISSDLVNVWNNIMVARTDRPLNTTRDAKRFEFSRNLVFGGNSFTPGPDGHDNMVGVNPHFAPGDGTGRFILAPDSPAVDAAGPEISAPETDVFNTPRPIGARADIGAVESH